MSDACFQLAFSVLHTAATIWPLLTRGGTPTQTSPGARREKVTVTLLLNWFVPTRVVARSFRTTNNWNINQVNWLKA